ncbi:hypothetical protein BQ1740_2555 [Bacillus subtilis]|nr:hypothetical protein BQ1740_2555 [Bacillus subtilis]
MYTNIDKSLNVKADLKRGLFLLSKDKNEKGIDSIVFLCAESSDMGI